MTIEFDVIENDEKILYFYLMQKKTMLFEIPCQIKELLLQEKNPNLVSIYKTIGYVDIELVFNVENIGKFHQIMEDLTIKFPYLIKNYTYIGDLETHKYEYFA